MNRVLLAGLALLIPQLCWAQVQIPKDPTAVGGPSTINGPKSNDGKTRREPPPPALPGSRAEPTAVAPADRSAADLPPTEALFDAINRGDLATAKDAIARGADLNGRNVLGLTPLEQSVDLGRNQISFLLLSLRGGAGYSTTSAPAPAEARGPTRAERLAALQAERAARQQAAAANRVAPTAPIQTARLFAGNGGAPVPQAGFLGFDPGR